MSPAEETIRRLMISCWAGLEESLNLELDHLHVIAEEQWVNLFLRTASDKHQARYHLHFILTPDGWTHESWERRSKLGPVVTSILSGLPRDWKGERLDFWLTRPSFHEVAQCLSQ